MCFDFKGEAAHLPGARVKIWIHSAPIFSALSKTLKTPPEADTWAPSLGFNVVTVLGFPLKRLSTRKVLFIGL